VWGSDDSLLTPLTAASRKVDQSVQRNEYTIYSDIPILQAKQLKRVDNTYCLASPRRMYFIYIDICPRPTSSDNASDTSDGSDTTKASTSAHERLVNPIPIWLYCFYEFLSRYDLEHLGALYTGENHHGFIYAVLNDLRRKAKEANEFHKLGPMALDAIALGSKPLVLAMMIHLANARKRAHKGYDESWTCPLYPTPTQMQTGGQLEVILLSDADVLQPETLYEVSAVPRFPLPFELTVDFDAGYSLLGSGLHRLLDGQPKSATPEAPGVVHAVQHNQRESGVPRPSPPLLICHLLLCVQLR